MPAASLPGAVKTMLTSIRPQDIADIIIMSFLVYLLYSWFRNTKALQVVIGLGFLGVIYVVTKNLGLLMTSWVFQELGTVLFVLIIVIFQTEIRQALYRFSLLSRIFGRQTNGARLDFMDVANEIFSLAAARTGAIIVFQRQEPLDEHLLHGVPLDSLVSGQLIGTIFRNGTPLHDGAVIIRDGRIYQASCHLPLSANPEVPHSYGTRHRAGLGLSERSDAAVVVVSEERGEVSLALAGKMQKLTTPEQLSEQLFTLLAPPVPEAVTVTWRERLLKNPLPKLVTVLLVISCWFIITARQGGIVVVTAPITFHNLPDDLILMKNAPEEVELRLNFFSSLTASPKDLDLAADVDLAKIKDGSNTIPLNTGDIRVPLGLKVTEINPGSVKVVAERKVSKKLRVRLRTAGAPAGGKRLKKTVVEPASVMVEGPKHILQQYSFIDTEQIELSLLSNSTTLNVQLLPPAPLVRILQPEPVRVHFNLSPR